MDHVAIDMTPSTEAVSERCRDLANVGHLFHRRTDEGGETFPFRLPNDPQAATKISRCIHHRIVRERGADFRQRMIEREVMRDDSGEHPRLACRLRRRAATNFQNATALFYVNWQIPNGPHKS